MANYDAPEAFRMYLAAQSVITAQVRRSNRTWVFLDEGLPPNYDGGKAMVIVSSPAEDRAASGVQEITFALHCYGRGANEAHGGDAREVANAAIGLLRQKGVANVTLAAGTARMLRARVISGPVYLPEPEQTGWRRYVVTVWTEWAANLVTA